MKRNFYLQNIKATKPTSIQFVGVENKKRYKLTLPIQVLPRHWDNTKQRPKASAPNANFINKLINAVNSRIDEIELEEIKKGKQADIDQIFWGLQKDDYRDVLTYGKYAVESKQLGKKSQATYKTLLRYLEKFQKQTSRSLIWEELTIDLFREFDYFLRTTQSCGRGARKLYFNTLKTIIKSAWKKRLHDNMEIDEWRILVKKNIQTAFTTEEILAIYQTEVPNERLERIRDIFVLNCFLGLRFSDWSLNPGLIRERKILAMNQKTLENVQLPIHPIAREILQKYGNTIQTERYNSEYYRLRDLFRYLEKLLDFLSTEIPYWIEVDGEYVKSTRKRVEAVSTHTARRSFCTNLYLKSQEYGLTVADIMRFSGHKQVDTFMAYICTDINKAEQVTTAMEREYQELLKSVSHRRAEVSLPSHDLA